MLEKLATIIRNKLGIAHSKDLPLIHILQGGTWQVGRAMAFKRSLTGEPPLRYVSNGVVF
ncbi:MAG: DUF1688 family protein [Proteobacteria bacterium]|nr:DUF1688 family protein [Pseudomonadota bacterium]